MVVLATIAGSMLTTGLVQFTLRLLLILGIVICIILTLQSFAITMLSLTVSRFVVLRINPIDKI